MAANTTTISLLGVAGGAVPLQAIETSEGSGQYQLATIGSISGTATIDNGTPITGQSLETGGSGVLGWLSSVRKKIADVIGATDDAKVTSPDGTGSLNALVKGLLATGQVRLTPITTAGLFFSAAANNTVNTLTTPTAVAAYCADITFNNASAGAATAARVIVTDDGRTPSASAGAIYSCPVTLSYYTNNLNIKWVSEAAATDVKADACFKALTF